MTEYNFTDLHCHILPGIDDGAEDMETTRAMLEQAYEDGIRTIVFTPHVRRPWLKIPEERIQQTYHRTVSLAKEISSELQLYLGSEVYYSHEVIEEYSQKLRPMNGTKYMLVEFAPEVPYIQLQNGIVEIQNRGYEVILAHIERYFCLTEDIHRVEHLYEAGVYLQMNASTVRKPSSWKLKRFLWQLLKAEQIHLISTDAHGSVHRRPQMSEAYQLITRKVSKEYADKICSENGRRMLQGEIL